VTEALHLDTHVVAWLYAGLVHQLSELAKARLEARQLWVSPAVGLELARWFEQGLIFVPPPEILADLTRRMGLEVCRERFDQVANLSYAYTWAEDPFDRLICAQAALAEAELLTKDAHLHKHFPRAVW
jgi:PIN domain nuclease of toxin-antitoxin system